MLTQALLPVVFALVRRRRSGVPTPAELHHLREKRHHALERHGGHSVHADFGERVCGVGWRALH